MHRKEVERTGDRKIRTTMDKAESRQGSGRPSPDTGRLGKYK
jgi:hypothetical protein